MIKPGYHIGDPEFDPRLWSRDTRFDVDQITIRYSGEGHAFVIFSRNTNKADPQIICDVWKEDFTTIAEAVIYFVATNLLQDYNCMILYENDGGEYGRTDLNSLRYTYTQLKEALCW